MNEKYTCNYCEGRGRVGVYRRTCHLCDGDGWTTTYQRPPDGKVEPAQAPKKDTSKEICAIRKSIEELSIRLRELENT